MGDVLSLIEDIESKVDRAQAEKLASKLKKGDEFSVLMSREMLDGKREQSQLLGVRLRSEGKIGRAHV